MGDDTFDLLQLAKGEPKDEKEKLARLREKIAHEHTGLGSFYDDMMKAQR